MSIIFGAVFAENKIDSPLYLKNLQSNFPGFFLQTHTDPCCIMGALHRKLSCTQADFIYSQQLSISVSVDAAFTNRTLLLRTLKQSTTCSNAELVVAAYLRWGKKCVQHFEGDFIFILYDKNARVFWGGTDRMGIRPLYYTQRHDIFIVASNINCLLPLMSKITINEIYLRQLLMQRFCKNAPFNQQTLYQDVTKIPAARLFTWDTRQIYFEKYWMLGEEKTTHSKNIRLAIANFEEYLSAAVKKYADIYSHVCLEVSGGLDSAAVALFTKLGNPEAQLLGITHRLPNDIPKEHRILLERDEVRYAQIITDFLDIPLHKFQKSYYAGIEEQFLQLGAWLSGAVSQRHVINNCIFFTTAANLGYPAIFSGFGGDQFVSNPATNYLCELKEKNRLRFFYEKIGCLEMSDVFQKIQMRIGLRKEAVNMDPLSADLKIVKQLFCPEWIEWLFEQRKQKIQVGSQVEEERASYDGWYANDVYNRLEANYQIAKYYAINYHFPLLDAELVNYFHQLPGEYKHRHGKGRYLMTQVLLKYFPRQLICRDTKKTFTAPANELEFVQTLQNLYKNLPPIAERQIPSNWVNHKIFSDFFSQTPPQLFGVLFKYILIERALQKRRIQAQPILSA